MPVHVTIWNEDSLQETHENVLQVYHQGINGVLASMFQGNEEFVVRTACL